jgi:heterodisulfide reductase subunit C
MQIIMFIVMIDFSRWGSLNTLQIVYELLKSLGKEIMPGDRVWSCTECNTPQPDSGW